MDNDNLCPNCGYEIYPEVGVCQNCDDEPWAGNRPYWFDNEEDHGDVAYDPTAYIFSKSASEWGDDFNEYTEATLNYIASNPILYEYLKTYIANVPDPLTDIEEQCVNQGLNEFLDMQEIWQVEWDKLVDLFKIVSQEGDYWDNSSSDLYPPVSKVAGSHPKWFEGHLYGNLSALIDENGQMYFGLPGEHHDNIYDKNIRKRPTIGEIGAQDWTTKDFENFRKYRQTNVNYEIDPDTYKILDLKAFPDLDPYQKFEVQQLLTEWMNTEWPKLQEEYPYYRDDKWKMGKTAIRQKPNQENFRYELGNQLNDIYNLPYFQKVYPYVQDDISRATAHGDYIYNCYATENPYISSDEWNDLWEKILEYKRIMGESRKFADYGMTNFPADYEMSPKFTEDPLYNGLNIASPPNQLNEVPRRRVRRRFKKPLFTTDSTNTEYLNDANINTYYSVRKDPEGDPLFYMINEVPMEELDMSVRAYNVLKRRGINTIGEIVAITPEMMTEWESDSQPGLGPRATREILELQQEIAGMGNTFRGWSI